MGGLSELDISAFDIKISIWYLLLKQWTIYYQVQSISMNGKKKWFTNLPTGNEWQQILSSCP